MSDTAPSEAIARLNAALEGRYRVEREIGAGGMATVYLAEDLRHHRKVALKVLKPELAALVGAERFLAEIETTANLNHPHILPLHDSGEADGFLFFVMPYVSGETLRERIDREKQLGVEEAIRITEKVASALDYAHEHGVVHRDIKPGNILLSERGEPTVADFGIALAVAHAGGGRVTETGLSVGTPHYMSPEQATGDRDVDPRTDVYALGCVLYEMMVGEPPYTGTTAQAILGKIIQARPVSATEARHSIPANVDAAIRKALEKLPADRFATAQEFAKALGDPGFRYGELAAAPAPTSPGRWRAAAVVAGAGALLLAAGLAWSLLRAEPPAPVTRVSVRIPDDQAFNPGGGYLSLSADGSFMVYQGIGDAGSQLWVRRWDALDATPIRGTEGARTGPAAISPDGQEVAFTAGNVLRVAPMQGGVSRTLAEGTSLCCPGWSPDGAWVYYNEIYEGLRRVPAGGEASETVTEVDTAAGDGFQAGLDVLPGGQGVVFSTRGPGGDRIQVVDVETGEVADLTPGAYPRYSPTGHLLFLDDEGTLLAAPFDLKSLKLTGAAVTVAEGLALLANGAGFYAASPNGTLVYRTGAAAGNNSTPMWVGRDGTARAIDPAWSSITVPTNSGPRLSPDGGRLALAIQDAEGRQDVWVKELETGPASRLTFEGQQNNRPTWSPDGRSLIFLSNRAGNPNVWTQRADGSDTARPFLDREAALQEAVYSPDETWLIFREGVNQAGDIYATRLSPDSAVVPLEATEFQERAVALSPNGRWLAYVSNRSERNEVFVRPFPEAGSSLRQVSVDGGTEPMWAHNGRELFYVNGSGELVAVEVSTDSVFTAGRQEVLFDASGYLRNTAYAMYDVTPDDQRFVMFRVGVDAADTAPSELILVENWADEFERQVGAR